MAEQQPTRRLGPKPQKQSVDITKVGGPQQQNVEGFRKVASQLNNQEATQNSRADIIRSSETPKRKIPGKTRPSK